MQILQSYDSYHNLLEWKVGDQIKRPSTAYQISTPSLLYSLYELTY